MDNPITTASESAGGQQPGDAVSPATSRFPVVGIGASAGGIEVLQTLFDRMPSDTGMAFVVILHLAREFESQAATLLQTHTSLPVAQVTGSVPIAPNRIYVIPPAKHLDLAEGTIQLSEPETEESRRAPIDHFFRTLADTHGKNAAAIILSGTGSDGSIGLRRVKEMGGGIFVQDPTEAEFDAMPRNAIATGLVDFVLPVASMPEVLIAYWRRAEIMLSAAPDLDHPSADAAALHHVLALLRVHTGHDFSQYKRPTILRRIGRRMQVMGVTDVPTYLEMLHSRPEEVLALQQDLLISVTNFFRDRVAWTALEAIVPVLFAGKGPTAQVRAWVAACATGEEAYSVAMLLAEHAQALDQPPSIQVFATDIHKDAIHVARQGVYPETIAGDVSAERLHRFFVLEKGRYRIKQELRDLVLFAHHNVLRDPPFSKLDWITCRNLLIYLNQEAQEQVIRLFHFSLLPGGYLLLGSAESLDGVIQLFDVVGKRERLFKQRAVPPLVPPVPFLGLAPRLVAAHDADHDHDRAARTMSVAELHQHLLVAHAPPSAIVNQDYELVHLSRGTGRFLRLEEGEPSVNLLRAIHPDLRLELRTALSAAVQQGLRTESRRIRVALDDGPHLVDLIVEPVQDPGSPPGRLFVLFDDAGPAAEAGGEVAPGTDAQAAELAAALRRTRAQLQMTVEQYETAGEEYKAANEELKAINEELRAASEELETSKEELQAVNEELTTVNQELKHKVEEVSQANNDLQNLIAATQIGIIFLDRELRITRYTPSVEDIFNLIPSDLNRPVDHVTHMLAYDNLVADAREVLATLRPTTRELSSTKGQWFLVQMRPYRTTDDRIAGVVLTFVDITNRKLAEAERERLLQAADQARQEAEAAVHVRDQFLSIASHELRTPLTALLGYAGMLQRGDATDMLADDRTQSRVAAVIRQTERLNALIEQLLDVSRLQQGQFTLEREPVDLVALAEQSVEEFRLTLSSAAQHRIELVLPDEPVPVLGDPSRLEAVVHNLIANAVKYSPQGETVEVRVRRQEADAVLEVIDRGIGIPPEARARLFEPFYRGGNVGPQISGFGIGLYIVQEIVARHGGRVELESAEGVGSTFRIVLPLSGAAT